MGGLSDFFRGEGSKRARHQARGLIEQERTSDRLYGDSTLEALRRGMGAQVAGYDQALDRASDISRSARREAISGSKEMLGELTTRYGAGGKFGTTALENARMGLQSKLTRDLEAIDSGFAGLFSELAIGKGNAIAGGENRIAALQQDRGEQESELFRLLQGTIRQPKAGILSGVLGAGGAWLGSVLGGPVDGALGGELGSAFGGSLERS